MIDLFNIVRNVEQSIDLREYKEGGNSLFSKKTELQYRVHMLAVVTITMFDFFATNLEFLDNPAAHALRQIECLSRFALVFLKNNADDTPLNRKIYNHNAASLVICITRLYLGRFGVLSYLFGFAESLYKISWILNRQSEMSQF